MGGGPVGRGIVPATGCFVLLVGWLGEDTVVDPFLTLFRLPVRGDTFVGVVALLFATFLGWTESAAAVCSSIFPVPAALVGNFAIADATASAAADATLFWPFNCFGSVLGGEGCFNVGIGNGFDLLLPLDTRLLVAPVASERLGTTSPNGFDN